MLNLPLALRLEKNKLIATEPWLMLLAVTLPDTTILRFARNTDDVVFAGNTYIRFAFELGDVRSSGDGKVQGVSLRVANPSRAFAPLMDANAGLVGCDVTLMVVHSGNLTEDYTELTLNWIIVASQSDEDWVTFSLGDENPFRRRFPLYTVLPNNCSWIFKGAECAYAGASSTCSRTLDNCRTLNNSARFGGRPGVIGAPRFIGR